MKHRTARRLISLVLTLAMALSLVPAAFAAEEGGQPGSRVTWEQVDNSLVSAEMDRIEAEPQTFATVQHADTDIVRVSIVLDKPSTIAAGYSTENIAENQSAMSYRDSLRNEQADVQTRIETTALRGKALDVVWNLTLAANIISANVAYGDIEAIRSVPGVRSVVLENRYSPAVVDADEPDLPQMATSSSMIGSQQAWAAGYTGAGSRIAVIDTGIDTDHQSFDGGALMYALKEEYSDEQIKAFSLLDADEINEKLPQMNVTARGEFTGEKLYLSEKIPFAFNYIDTDHLYVTHDEDTQSEHGSHVEGIAAANRYIPVKDEAGNVTYEKALNSVFVQGVAPDAQIITMKVFGKNGGAWDSDYFAGIEDAIILGADSINLSLGSTNAGVTHPVGLYQQILQDLEETNSVVVISAGNSGAFTDNSVNGVYADMPYPYVEDVNFDTVSSPGSFKNALTVASVDNVGSTGYYFTYGENENNHVIFTESTSKPTTVPDLITLKGEKEYILFENIGVDTAGNDLLEPYAEEIKDKVVFVYRGESTFPNKQQTAANHGAIACIVMNNTTGTINMDLSASTATIPCVAITQADAEAIKAASTAKTGKDGNTYYTGKMEIFDTFGTNIPKVDFYTMSDFSSWGVPGDLSLKPEITAPGGNIYSVNGLEKGGKGYESMSGTSMAAPQVTGMVALVAQYAKEKGLDDGKAGLSTRQLAQSLLMSTAVPLYEEASSSDTQKNYYSILKQGSGLANVNNAVTAGSYVTVDGQADGKVKVELGDDPDREGVYEARFSIHNFSDKPLTYHMRGDVFTQGAITGPGALGGEFVYLDTATTPLDATIAWSASTVTVPAGGDVDVTATITLSPSQKAALDSTYPNGAYIEAYLYADPGTDDEGVQGVAHSIPVLGFYGKWGDASMYDSVGLVDMDVYYGKPGDKIPYSAYYVNALFSYDPARDALNPIIGNPFVLDDEYLPERNAINLDYLLLGQLWAGVIRNAGAGRLALTNADTGEVYMEDEVYNDIYAMYYNSSAGDWATVQTQVNFNWNGTDSKGQRVPDGTAVNASITLATEYDVDYTLVTSEEDGATVYDVERSVDWDSLGRGATLSIPVTVDCTAPKLIALDDAALDNGYLTIDAQDNAYIAAIRMVDMTGTKQVALFSPNQTERGAAISDEIYLTDVDGNYLVNGESFYIQIFDYAGNYVTYRIQVDLTPSADPYYNYVDRDGMIWYGISKDGQQFKTGDTVLDVAAAEYVDGYVFLADSTGYLYTTPQRDTLNITRVGPLKARSANVTDMSYDAVTKKLYLAYEDGAVAAVEPATGAVTDVYQPAIPGAKTLAISDGGTFYTVVGNTIYSYTLETLEEPQTVGNVALPDEDGAGSLEWDAEAGELVLLRPFSVSGPSYFVDLYTIDPAGLTAKLIASRRSEEPVSLTGLYVKGSDSNNLDFNGDGFVNDLDGQALLDYVTGVRGSIMKTAYADVDHDGDVDTHDSYVFLHTDVSNSVFAPVDEVTGVTISQDTLELKVTQSAALEAFVTPWYTKDRTIIWESSNPESVTVDQSGNIYAKWVGAAQITATSAADPSFKAACTVTVMPWEYEFTGAVVDANDQAKLFTWNMATDDAWTETATLEHDFVSTAYDKNHNNVIAMDEEGIIYTFDADTGELIYKTTKPFSERTWNDGDCPVASDMAVIPSYNGKTTGSCLLIGFYGRTICVFDSMTDYYTSFSVPGIPGSYVNIGYYSSDIGDGFIYGNSDYFYALDDYGDIQYLMYTVLMPSTLNRQSVGLSGTYTTSLSGSELETDFGSMVKAENRDALIAAIRSGETTELYIIEGRIVNGSRYYDANKVAIFDDGTKVLNLLTVNYAGTDEASANAAAPEAESFQWVETKEELANGETLASILAPYEDAKRAANPGDGTLNAANPTSSGSQTGVDGDTVTVTVTADGESSNGLVKVTYDAASLEIVSTDSSIDRHSINTKADGTVVVGWATGDEPLPEGAVVATLVFQRRSSWLASSQISIETWENNEDNAAGGGPLSEQSMTLEFPTPPSVNPPVTQPETQEPQNPASPAFTDLDPDAWYYDYVTDVIELGLMKGTADGLFEPAGTVTRAQMVQVLWNHAGNPAVDTAISFSDVAENAWYTDAIRWAVGAGVVNGYDDGAFKPNAVISRQEMATMLYRYEKYLGGGFGEDWTYELPFTDAEAVSQWAYEAVAWCTMKGVINGMGDNTFAPAGTARRSELAAVLVRYLSLEGK